MKFERPNLLKHIPSDRFPQQHRNQENPQQPTFTKSYILSGLENDFKYR